MPLETNNAKRNWPLLVVGVGIAACIWGVYAWQSSTPPGKPDDDQPEIQKPADPPQPIPIDEVSAPPDTSATTTMPDESSTESNDEPPPVDVDTAVPSPGGIQTSAPSPSPDDDLDSTLGLIQSDQIETAKADLKAGRDALARGDFIAARTAFSKAVDKGLPTPDENYARVELARIADTTLFSRARLPNDPLVTQHKVVPRDSMAKIVGPMGITIELAARINQIKNPQIVRLDSTLKLVRGPFNAVIDKSDHRMDIWLGDVYVRSFNVGLGADAGTPTGLWAVRNKLINPEWIDPSTGHRYLADAPDNPIGERWIGLQGLTGNAIGRSGFGIHGTIEPESIGRDQSMGCIRLVADDVAWVYDLLVEGKSRVAVRE